MIFFAYSQIHIFQIGPAHLQISWGYILECFFILYQSYAIILD